MFIGSQERNIPELALKVYPQCLDTVSEWVRGWDPRYIFEEGGYGPLVEGLLSKVGFLITWVLIDHCSWLGLVLALTPSNTCWIVYLHLLFQEVVILLSSCCLLIINRTFARDLRLSTAGFLRSLRGYSTPTSRTWFKIVLMSLILIYFLNCGDFFFGVRYIKVWRGL